jgi:hypothetical protein
VNDDQKHVQQRSEERLRTLCSHFDALKGNQIQTNAAVYLKGMNWMLDKCKPVASINVADGLERSWGLPKRCRRCRQLCIVGKAICVRWQCGGWGMPPDEM